MREGYRARRGRARVGAREGLLREGSLEGLLREGSREGSRDRPGPSAIDASSDERNGGGGIRTLETLTGLPVFKTGTFNRSATPPAGAGV